MEPTKETAIVHKEGEEGTLLIDRYTGRIVTPLIERPDWAEGLHTALVRERDAFYQGNGKQPGEAGFVGNRLGKAYTDEMRNPAAYVFQDLGWLGQDAEQEECTIDADNDYRMEVIATVLGINREDFETPITGTVAEIEIDLEARHVSKAELGEIERELLPGFEDKHPEAAKLLKEGTND